jgi:hypothetical protein
MACQRVSGTRVSILVMAVTSASDKSRSKVGNGLLVSRLGRRGPAGTGTTTLLNVCEGHPCYRLEAPGGAKRSSASSSRCRTNSRRISSSRAWLATRESGWLAALASSAWASVCSSNPIRLGFILAPRHPVPYAPVAAGESDAEMPKGPPGGARAFGCEGSCRAVRCRAGRRSVGQARGVWSTGCAWRLVLAAHAAAPSFHPGPRGAASLGGLSPAGLVIPGPAPIPFEGAGPWLMPWTWSGQTPPRIGVQKYPALVAAPLVTTGSHQRGAIDLRGDRRRRSGPLAGRHSLEAALDGGSALNLGSAPWPG